MSHANAFEFNVVETPTVFDVTDWTYISQRASNEQLLQFLKDANLLAINLSRIAWRMKERNVFIQITNLLRKRMCYDETLWQYCNKFWCFFDTFDIFFSFFFFVSPLPQGPENYERIFVKSSRGYVTSATLSVNFTCCVRSIFR